MSRAPLVAGLATAIVLTACNPSSSASDTTAPTSAVETSAATTTVATTTAEATTPPTSTTADTASPSTAPTTENQSPVADGTVVELPQFGVTFVLPAPFEEVPKPQFDYSASSPDPLGFFTLLECGDCSLDVPEGDGETHERRTLDGVPTLIVHDKDLPVGDGFSVNEIVIADGQRNFTVIMSYAGDIDPLWNAFIDSITFTDPDPSASEPRVPAPTNPDGSITLEELGLTFDLPDGFVDNGNPADFEFSATRPAPDLAVMIVVSCQGCGRDTMDDGETTVEDTEIDGVPVVLGESTVDDTPAHGLLILADGRESVVSMVGEGTDEAWDELVASLRITPT